MSEDKVWLCDCTGDSPHDCPICHEYGNPDHVHLLRDVSKLKSENERLREAMTAYASHLEHHGYFGCSMCAYLLKTYCHSSTSAGARKPSRKSDSQNDPTGDVKTKDRS